MKIIFSRKGMDSSKESGGMPSAILNDGRMISFPIPDKASNIKYQDIKRYDLNVGIMVNELSSGKISPAYNAHLDPDLIQDSIPRKDDWVPIFGQAASAQGHLTNNGISENDLFIFFGLFKDVEMINGHYIWQKGAKLKHVIWGWMQIEKIFKIDEECKKQIPWASYHPHFLGERKNNTLYLAKKRLIMPGLTTKTIDGSGVMNEFNEQFQLTQNDSEKVSIWELPLWFYPENRKPLSYHRKRERWEKRNNHTILNVVSKGQEFILDCDEYPEAPKWIENLLRGTINHDTYSSYIAYPNT